MLVCRIAAAALIGLATASSGAAYAEPMHGIAMHGDLLYPPDFQHFRYADPDAPKGGSLTIGTAGSFDSLNPLVVRGVPALGVREYVFESLMARSFDEPFSLYGLLAESVEVPEDRSWISFTLDPRARFSDGEPVTVEDVIFSWELLKEKGRPNHRTYYNQVSKVTRLDENSLRFDFAGPPDREMPLIMGLMPVLPSHHYDPDSFDQSGLATPVGSGPYVVAEVAPGSSITYRRDPDYWAADLPVRRGFFNFDEIRYEYYRDANTLFESFKKGLTDIRPEDDPARWATGYDFPAVSEGHVVLDEFDTRVPRGMSGFVFNTRRPVFADRRVRKALLHLFDGAWINATLYHGLYSRTGSYFHGSELSFRGEPASEHEREILRPWIDRIPDAILDGSYQVPQSDGSGRDREALRQALTLLTEAGYRLEDGVMRHADTGRALGFEVLVVTRDQERLALSYARLLQRAGIQVTVRQIDSAQFERRRQTYDYDMIQNFWYASLSPGNEQKFYWGSEAASVEGTRNYMGVADPAIDAAIEAMLAARDRESFVAATRALDRVLMSGIYVVPLFHLPRQWVGRWDHIGRPETTSLFGYTIDTWWHSAAGSATQ